ncbi:glycoside hydrolase family 5 protein [Allorhizobium undicola]|uniref:glycoside hydrolase family 5 protein n=1 Tax=Allorhizobium undicola TaxID=78527 RepID=UPI003D34950F
MTGRLCAAVLACATAAVSGPGFAAEACFRGINLSGAEFGDVGGKPMTDYAYPTEATIRYFAEKGFNSVRLPFRWEHLQPEPQKPLDADELKRLDTTIRLVKKQKMRIVLDPHNFGSYYKKQVNTADVPVEQFADLWARLAERYGNDQAIAFGLMNEPFDMPASQWLAGANGAIAAIRATGAKNLILVPGTAWTGAHSWESDSYGGANGVIMLGIKDPANNYAYEVHQYFDRDFSGTHDDCSRATDAVAAIDGFTRWLRKNNRRGYLGEFGAPGAAQCVQAIRDMTALVEKNSDRWVGWAYWAAGDWWPETEALNIQPGKNGDRPQMAGLLPALKDYSAAASDCPSLRRR